MKKSVKKKVVEIVVHPLIETMQLYNQRQSQIEAAQASIKDCKSRIRQYAEGKTIIGTRLMKEIRQTPTTELKVLLLGCNPCLDISIMNELRARELAGDINILRPIE